MQHIGCLGGPLNPLSHLRDMAPPNNGVTILTFWGHVTSLVTWPFDSRWTTSYGWSIVTMYLTCTVREIKSPKLAFAHVKGQKFTVHAPCYVTCRQGVQNNRIFGIPEATLAIHYATLLGLWWQL